MRMSCNGCRVLRKGCSEGCTIRPCLQWIESPEAQANATVFIAKFYGRAGLINLISAGPDRLRPAIFRSLLYEACGRILNPIYGSVGLLWSGNWPLCQAAVDSVLKGEPVARISPNSAVSPAAVPGFKFYDIRRIVKNPERAAGNLNRVAAKSRSNFKRPGFNPSTSAMLLPAEIREVEEGSRSATSEEGSDVSQGEPKVALDLTLGLELAVGKAEMKLETAGAAGSCQVVELGLSLAALHGAGPSTAA